MASSRKQTLQKLRNCPKSRYSKYFRYSRIVKFGRNCEIWSTIISLVWKGLTEFILVRLRTSLGLPSEGVLKMSPKSLIGVVKLAKIVKFGGNYEIWSTPISLVWMSLIHNNELMVRLGTFVIVIVFVFVVVFLLVRSCFLITLIKCLKGQKSLGSLCNVRSKSV